MTPEEIEEFNNTKTDLSDSPLPEEFLNDLQNVLATHSMNVSIAGLYLFTVREGEDGHYLGMDAIFAPVFSEAEITELVTSAARLANSMIENVQ